MGDEEKSIEAIIAELEILEAKKKETALEEKTDEGEKDSIVAGSTVEQSPEEPSREEPREEMFTEATLDMPDMEPAEDEKIEESPEEQKIEPAEQEPGMRIFPEEFAKEQPDEPETPLEAFPGREDSIEPSIEMPVEEPREEMFTEATLGMPDMEPAEDEKIEESPEEQKIEPRDEPAEQEPGMRIFPEEFAKEQPDEPATPLEPFAAGDFPQDGPIREDADAFQSEEPFEESLQEPSADTVNDEDQPGDVPPGEDGGEPPSLPPESGGSTRGTRLVLLLVLLLAGVVAYAYFVWPTMYEYSSRISAGKKYEVRVNRITGDQQHYDGVVWHRGQIMSPSAQVAKPGTVKALEKERQPAEDKATATESSEVEVKTLSKAPEEEPAAVQQSLQEPLQSEAGEPPVASQPATEKKAGETETVKSDEEKIPVAEDKTPIKEEKYVVQLGSMKFREFAEALVTKLSRQGFDAHMHSFKSEKTGIWHVVSVGRFNSRVEASEFLKKHDLKKIYPGSFVRTANLAPVEAKK